MKVYYSDEAVNKYTESGDESVIVPSMKSTGHMHPILPESVVI